MSFFLVPIGLVLLGSLSPLLTFLWLFQTKEWRLDRLAEHLRREGWMQAMGGRLRPTIIAALVLCLAVAPIPVAVAAIWGILLVPAFLTLAQIAAGRQRMPDWTKKAALIAALALVLDVILATIFAHLTFALLLLTVLQGVVAIIAWTLVLPLDLRLKKKIFAAATARRANLPGLCLIGIVGSVGKTTTKELIRAALAGREPLVTPAHVNTELGLAQWFLRETSGWTTSTMRPVVVEMGAYRRGEIALISSVLKPTMAVVTALGSDHLALFGSEEAIVDANAEILAALPTDGTAVLLADSPATAALASRCTGRVFLAGTTDTAKVRADGIRETADGLTFAIDGSPVRLLLAGAHNAANAALAVAVADSLGIARAESVPALAKASALPGTFQVTFEHGLRVLNDTYNISPLSLRAALAWAGNQPERPRVLLTAGLLEVGTEEERFMRELGEFANGKIERAVIVGGRGASAFAQGFGGPVLPAPSDAVPAGGLLLCVGRLSHATIRQHLS